MEFVFCMLIFLSKALLPDLFWLCLSAVAVSMMQVLSVASSFVFSAPPDDDDCVPYFGGSKSKSANGFSTKQPEPQPESQVHVGGWQMAVLPQRRGGSGGCRSLSAALSAPCQRRECGECGESGVERQGQGDSCRTPRPHHLDGK